jgi:hypothetical protein
VIIIKKTSQDLLVHEIAKEEIKADLGNGDYSEKKAARKNIIKI